MVLQTFCGLAALLQGDVEGGTTSGSALPRFAEEAEDVRALLAEYEFDPAPFEWRLEAVRESRRFRQLDLTFPSPVTTDVEANNAVPGHYYLPAGDGPFPALVVLHWLGGDYGALRMFASLLAGRGVAALMIYMPYYERRRGESEREMVSVDIDATVANFRQAVMDVRRAVHWLRGRPEVEPARVGVMGVSLGAIVGALAAGVDPSISPVIPVIGGGNLADAIAAFQGLDDGAREELRGRIRGIEPLTFAHRIDGGRTLMLNAEEDEVIPREATEALAAAIGDVRIVWMPGGHYGVVAGMPRILDEVVAFVRPSGGSP